MQGEIASTFPHHTHLFQMCPDCILQIKQDTWRRSEFVASSVFSAVYICRHGYPSPDPSRWPLAFLWHFASVLLLICTQGQNFHHFFYMCHISLAFLSPLPPAFFFFLKVKILSFSPHFFFPSCIWGKRKDKGKATPTLPSVPES